MNVVCHVLNVFPRFSNVFNIFIFFLQRFHNYEYNDSDNPHRRKAHGSFNHVRQVALAPLNPHLIHGSLNQRDFADRFRCGQQTDRQTDRQSGHLAYSLRRDA